MTRVISGGRGKHLGKRDRPGLGAGPGGEGRPGLRRAAGGSYQDHFLLQLLHISLLFFPLHFSSLPHFRPPFKSWAWVQLPRGHGPLLSPVPHGPPWRWQTQLSWGEGGPEHGGDGGSAQGEVGGRVARWGWGGGAEAGGGLPGGQGRVEAGGRARDRVGAALSRGAGADAERQWWLRGGVPGPGPAGAMATPSSVVTKASGQFWPRVPGWACSGQGRLPPQGLSLGVMAGWAGARRAPWQLMGDAGPAWG